MRGVTGKDGEGLQRDMWDCEETGGREVTATGIKGAAGVGDMRGV